MCLYSYLLNSRCRANSPRPQKGSGQKARGHRATGPTKKVQDLRIHKGQKQSDRGAREGAPTGPQRAPNGPPDHTTRHGPDPDGGGGKSTGGPGAWLSGALTGPGLVTGFFGPGPDLT